MNKNIKAAYKRTKNELLPEPCVPFTLKAQKTGVYDCKVGGVPYFPKSERYPVGENGKPLTLLAQLNFEKIPHISDFPEKGILQFFIANDSLYGMSLSDMTEQKNFRVIYHADVIADESLLYTEDDVPTPLCDAKDDGYMPFDGEYILVPEAPYDAMPNTCDYRFEDVFVRHYKDVTGKNIEGIGELNESAWNDIGNLCGQTPDVCIGGYPAFTQLDPRGDNDSLTGYNVALFHMCSVYDKENGVDIMWGDEGTGTFLIPRENLRRRDFSKVLYNYDCY